MSFLFWFLLDGCWIVYLLEKNGNIDIYQMDVWLGVQCVLINVFLIEILFSYSLDGQQIVFESDCLGLLQFYIMGVNGGELCCISFGDGCYGMLVWLLCGDMIVFICQVGGKFYIGVMCIDGLEEKMLIELFFDEGLFWVFNGCVVMFICVMFGGDGVLCLYLVDIIGCNMCFVQFNGVVLDFDWGLLLL